MNRPVSLEYEREASCSAWILLRAVLSRKHNHRSQPFKSCALHTRTFCRLNRAFGTRPWCTLFSYVANALWTKEIAHNGTIEGEKNRDWIFHVRKIICVSFGNDSPFLFLDEWTFYGLFSMIFQKRNLSNLVSYSITIFIYFVYIFQYPSSENLVRFLFVLPQCIKVFQFNLIFSLQTKIRQILQNYYKI